VVHEINNPLATIAACAESLETRIAEGAYGESTDVEDLKEYLGLIRDEAFRCKQITNGLLNFSRLRAGNRVPINLADTIKMTARLVTHQHRGDNIQIEIETVNDLPCVLGDDGQLQQAIVVLATNAIDAMPEGGTLSLTTRIAADSVIVKVVDTGVGMYPEVRSRIFDPFFTTKGTAGLGLGLAVSFGIIRRHGGNIEVESQYGKGTEFRITLPVAKSGAKSVRQVEEVETVAPALSHCTPLVSQEKPRTRMLVVDDEDFVRELIGEILEGEQCDVYLAESGAAALSAFSEMEFDGVFTDVGMPGLSGWELAREIRQINASIPIAVITGWGEAVGSIEQKEAGVNWVVAKPFTADRIIELARDIGSASQSSVATASA
jgi:CheY-like chemotaxis protein/two-component sensor histidine kinase